MLKEKSYSPVSHPDTIGAFDLLVKAYPLAPLGGFGKYLCDMEVGAAATMKVCTCCDQRERERERP